MCPHARVCGDQVAPASPSLQSIVAKCDEGVRSGPAITGAGDRPHRDGLPFSLPSLLIPRAKEFPELRIVLAHAGNNFYVAEAIIAAQCCDNILLEPSWCGPHRVKEAVHKLGAGRILFGSDLPLNVIVELTKFRNIGLTDTQLEQCLSGNAIREYKLPVQS